MSDVCRCVFVWVHVFPLLCSLSAIVHTQWVHLQPETIHTKKKGFRSDEAKSSGNARQDAFCGEFSAVFTVRRLLHQLPTGETPAASLNVVY